MYYLSKFLCGMKTIPFAMIDTTADYGVADDFSGFYYVCNKLRAARKVALQLTFCLSFVNSR